MKLHLPTIALALLIISSAIAGEPKPDGDPAIVPAGAVLEELWN